MKKPNIATLVLATALVLGLLVLLIGRFNPPPLPDGYAIEYNGYTYRTKLPTRCATFYSMYGNKYILTNDYSYISRESDKCIGIYPVEYKTKNEAIRGAIKNHEQYLKEIAEYIQVAPGVEK